MELTQEQVEAIQEAAEALAHAIGAMVEVVREAVEALVNWGRDLFGAWVKRVEQATRTRAAHRLEALGVPGTMARWMAEHWPARWGLYRWAWRGWWD